MIETMTAMEMKQALLFDVDSDAEIVGLANECYMLENVGLVAYEADNKAVLGKSVGGAFAAISEFIKRIAAKLVQWASAAARTIRISIMKFQKAKAEKRLKDVKATSIPEYLKEILDKANSLTRDLTSINIDSAFWAKDNDTANTIMNKWEEIGSKYAKTKENNKNVTIDPSAVVGALAAAMNAVMDINKEAADLNKKAVQIAKSDKENGVIGSSLSMKRTCVQKGTSIKMSMARKIFNAALTATNVVVVNSASDQKKADDAKAKADAKTADAKAKADAKTAKENARLHNAAIKEVARYEKGVAKADPKYVKGLDDYTRTFHTDNYESVGPEALESLLDVLL